MRTKKRVLIYLWTVAVALFVLSGLALGAAVQPLVFDLKAAPGETIPFSVAVTAQDVQEIIDVSLYGVLQGVDGNLQYSQDFPNPALNWVQLDSNRIVIPPNEERQITGVVRVPLNAEGTHVVILMVEPDAGITSGQVTFRFRYAVRLVINVERAGLRPDVVLESVGLQGDAEGNPIIRAIIHNKSSLLFPVSAEVTIRDENRALVERIQLRPTGQLDPSQPPSINIYPGATLWLDGLVTKPLFPGTYDLRLFTYYADGRQRVHADTFEVEHMAYASAAELFLTVEPESIAVNVTPGGANSQVLTLTNNTTDKLFVEIGAAEIAPNYPYSIFDNFTVELRTPTQVEIEARRSARPVVIIRSPRDIKPGGYYGQMMLTTTNENGELVSQQAVPIAAVVGQDFEYAAEIQSAAVTSTAWEESDNTWMLSLVVQNLGNIHIEPVGTVYLKNTQGEIIRTLRTELQEGAQAILPGQTGYLISSDFTVEPGEYTAEMRVFAAGQELVVREESITVSQTVEEDR